MIFRKQFFLLAFLGISAVTNGQPLYTGKLIKSSGETVSMEQFKGRKLMVTIMDQTSKDNMDTLVLFKQMYPSLQVISLSMQVSKSSAVIEKSSFGGGDYSLNVGDAGDKAGVNNYELVKWLTTVEGNQHFNVPKLENGLKFFIDESGELYAVIPFQISLLDPRLDRVINRNPNQNAISK